jgi:uncharacterized membrane protein HdeD (DUF308 family)
VIRTLVKDWPLLTFCGTLQAAISVIYFIMQRTDAPIAFHSWNGTIVLAGKLALAAGAFTVAAGLLRSSSAESWLLVLNGVALSALGLIQFDLAARYRISFLVVALLVITMAISFGVLESLMARTARHEYHTSEGRLLAAVSVASFAFAFVFLALGLQWIKLSPGTHADLGWLGAYFAFSAISTLWLAMRWHGHRASRLIFT